MPAATGTVRMTLRINGFEYVVHPLGIRNSRRMFKLRKKESGQVAEEYIVEERHDGTRCDCPDYRARRGRGRDPDGCKHIKSLRTFYMVI